MITADGNLEYTFALEITAAKIAILLLGNNNEGPAKWGPRIIAALPEIDRELAVRKRPFLMRLSADGTIAQLRLYRTNGTRVVKLSITRKRREELDKLDLV